MDSEDQSRETDAVATSRSTQQVEPPTSDIVKSDSAESFSEGRKMSENEGLSRISEKSDDDASVLD